MSLLASSRFFNKQPLELSANIRRDLWAQAWCPSRPAFYWLDWSRKKFVAESIGDGGNRLVTGVGGYGHWVTGGASLQWFASRNKFNGPTDEYTVISVIRAKSSSTSASNCVYYGYGGLRIGDGTNYRPSIWTRDAGEGGETLKVTSDADLVVNQDYAICYVQRTGVGKELYVNGVRTGYSASTANLISDATATAVYLGYIYWGTYFGGVINRAVHESEAVALTRDPFGWIFPAQDNRRVWVPAAAPSITPQQRAYGPDGQRVMTVLRM